MHPPRWLPRPPPAAHSATCIAQMTAKFVAERLPSSGSSSQLFAMMLAIRSLCGQVKEAQAPEAGANRTISDVSRDISMQLDGMEALLSRGEWENIQLRALAEEAEQSALHVRATAAVMVRLAGGHK